MLKNTRESTREAIRAWKASPEYLVGYDILKYSCSGLWLTVYPDRGLLSFPGTSQQVRGSRVRNFAGKTTEGIALGASLEDIEEVYGKHTINGSPEFVLPKHGIGVVSYPTLGLTCTMFDGKVCDIGAVEVQTSSAPPNTTEE